MEHATAQLFQIVSADMNVGPIKQDNGQHVLFNCASLLKEMFEFFYYLHGGDDDWWFEWNSIEMSGF